MNVPQILFINAFKLVGLGISVNEVFFAGSPDPTMIVMGASMMASAQMLDMLIAEHEGGKTKVIKPPKRPKQPKLPKPVVTPVLTHVEKVYKLHGIYQIPDPDVHMLIPEPFADMDQFEMDITAAIILDGKSKKKTNPVAVAHDDLPKAKTTPVMLQPGEQVLNRRSQISRIQNGTPGCVCSTPYRNNHIVSIVFEGEGHVSCIWCGLVLSADHDAWDERVRARTEKIERLTEEFQHPEEESFMVDQVRDPINTCFSDLHNRLNRLGW